MVSGSIIQDDMLTAAAPGVLVNDTHDIPITAAIVTAPSMRTLKLYPDGSFSYIPNAAFRGTDSFTYRAYDGPDGSNIATICHSARAQASRPAPKWSKTRRPKPLSHRRP